MSLNGIRAGRIPNSMKKFQPKISKREQKETNHNISLNFLIKYRKLDLSNLTTIQNFVPKAYMTKNGLNENQLIVLSLLRDKSYQLFKEHTKEFEKHETKAKQLIQSGYTIAKCDITKEMFVSIKNTILEILTKHALAIFQLIQEIPGFQRFDKGDINTLIKDNFFFLFGVRTKCLCKNNDYYLFLGEGIQLSKDTLGIIVGEEVRDNIFEFNSLFSMLNLTDQEFGLLIPFYLSISSNLFKLNKKFN